MPMKLTLHHVNLVTRDVPGMDAFYRNVLGLRTETDGLPTLEKRQGYAGDVAFVTDGAIQTHLAQKDPLAGFNAVGAAPEDATTLYLDLGFGSTKAGFPRERPRFRIQSSRLTTECEGLTRISHHSGSRS